MAGTDVDRRPDYAPVHVPGTPRPARRPEGAIPRAWHGARKNRHLSVPLAVPPATWTAGEILHVYGMTWETGVGGAMLTACVAYFAAHKWDRRTEQWYAGASAAGLSGWLTAASAAGPASGTPGIMLGVTLTAGGIAWGVPYWSHKRPRGARKRDRLLREWQAWWQGHCYAWGLAGSRVIEAEHKRSQVRIRVQLSGGKQSLQHVQGQVHLIESALDGHSDIGLVRVAAVKGHPSQADIFMKRDNPLREVIAWDSSFVPSSVHEDAVLGMSETGELVRAPLRASSFINGMSRSGKSNHLFVRVVQLSACPDDRQFVIDLKQRNAREMLKTSAVDWVITDPAEARACLRLLLAEIGARAREWDQGQEQALATTTTPALHALIDETNPLTAAGPGAGEASRLLGLVASQGMGLEVYCEVSTQYGALDESVQTEQTRSNLPLRICYRTESKAHGEFALSDSPMCDTSKLEEKGEFLMKLGPKARQERVRAPHMPFSLFKKIMADRPRAPRLMLYCGAEPSGIDGLTWQEWYDRRHLRINPAFRAISPQYAAAVEEFGEPQAAPAARPERPSGYDPGPEHESGAAVSARIAAETSGPDLAPTPEAVAKAPTKAQLRRLFADTVQGAPGGISPAEVMRVTGMPRSTVMSYFTRLLDRGAVTRPEEGVYMPVPGRHVHAELEAARSGDEMLRQDGEARLRLVQPAS